MGVPLPSDRLLSIIAAQNEIAAAALSLDGVMAIVTTRACELLDASAAVLELVEGDEMVYRAACGTAAPHVGLRLPRATSLSGRCVQEGRALLCVDAATDRRVDHAAALRVGAVSMICVPLRQEDAVVGVLKVYDRRPGVFGPTDVETLELLSGVISSHMSHATAFEQEARDSRRDALTRLPNRRAFDERVALELARTRRHGDSFALCLLDLDRFKEVNDTLGHAAGDEVLAAVAGHLLEVRGEDAAFRFGGDEFALLLAGVGEEGATTAVARVAEAVAVDPACLGVRLSYGTTVVQAEDDCATLLARADRALYAAKAAVKG